MHHCEGKKDSSSVRNVPAWALIINKFNENMTVNLFHWLYLIGSNQNLICCLIPDG